MKAYINKDFRRKNSVDYEEGHIAKYADIRASNALIINKQFKKVGAKEQVIKRVANEVIQDPRLKS